MDVYVWKDAIFFILQNVFGYQSKSRFFMCIKVSFCEREREILQMSVKGHIMGCATSSHKLKEIYY